MWSGSAQEGKELTDKPKDDPLCKKPNPWIPFVATTLAKVAAAPISFLPAIILDIGDCRQKEEPRDPFKASPNGRMHDWPSLPEAIRKALSLSRDEVDTKPVSSTAVERSGLILQTAKALEPYRDKLSGLQSLLNSKLNLIEKWIALKTDAGEGDGFRLNLKNGFEVVLDTKGCILSVCRPDRSWVKFDYFADGRLRKVRESTGLSFESLDGRRFISSQGEEIEGTAFVSIDGRYGWRQSENAEITQAGPICQERLQDGRSRICVLDKLGVKREIVLDKNGAVQSVLIGKIKFEADAKGELVSKNTGKRLMAAKHDERGKAKFFNEQGDFEFQETDLNSGRIIKRIHKQDGGKVSFSDTTVDLTMETGVRYQFVGTRQYVEWAEGKKTVWTTDDPSVDCPEWRSDDGRCKREKRLVLPDGNQEVKPENGQPYILETSGLERHSLAAEEKPIWVDRLGAKAEIWTDYRGRVVKKRDNRGNEEFYKHDDRTDQVLEVKNSRLTMARIAGDRWLYTDGRRKGEEWFGEINLSARGEFIWSARSGNRGAELLDGTEIWQGAKGELWRSDSHGETACTRKGLKVQITRGPENTVTEVRIGSERFLPTRKAGEFVAGERTILNPKLDRTGLTYRALNNGVETNITIKLDGSRVISDASGKVVQTTSADGKNSYFGHDDKGLCFMQDAEGNRWQRHPTDEKVWFEQGFLNRWKGTRAVDSEGNQLIHEEGRIPYRLLTDGRKEFKQGADTLYSYEPNANARVITDSLGRVVAIERLLGTEVVGTTAVAYGAAGTPDQSKIQAVKLPEQEFRRDADGSWTVTDAKGTQAWKGDWIASPEGLLLATEGLGKATAHLPSGAVIEVANGLVARARFAGGLTCDLSYDARNQLKLLHFGNGVGFVKREGRWELYAERGVILEKALASIFRHDLSCIYKNDIKKEIDYGLLKSVSVSAEGQLVLEFSNGNRLVKELQSDPFERSDELLLSEDHRILSKKTRNGDQSCQYSADGALITDTTSTAAMTIKKDSFGRVVSARQALDGKNDPLLRMYASLAVEYDPKTGAVAKLSKTTAKKFHANSSMAARDSKTYLLKDGVYVNEEDPKDFFKAAIEVMGNGTLRMRVPDVFRYTGEASEELGIAGDVYQKLDGSSLEVRDNGASVERDVTGMIGSTVDCKGVRRQFQYGVKGPQTIVHWYLLNDKPACRVTPIIGDPFKGGQDLVREIKTDDKIVESTEDAANWQRRGQSGGQRKYVQIDQRSGKMTELCQDGDDWEKRTHDLNKGEPDVKKLRLDEKVSQIIDKRASTLGYKWSSAQQQVDHLREVIHDLSPLEIQFLQEIYRKRVPGKSLIGDLLWDVTPMTSTAWGAGWAKLSGGSDADVMKGATNKDHYAVIAMLNEIGLPEERRIGRIIECVKELSQWNDNRGQPTREKLRELLKCTSTKSWNELRDGYSKLVELYFGRKGASLEEDLKNGSYKDSLSNQGEFHKAVCDLLIKYPPGQAPVAEQVAVLNAALRGSTLTIDGGNKVAQMKEATGATYIDGVGIDMFMKKYGGEIDKEVWGSLNNQQVKSYLAHRGKNDAATAMRLNTGVVRNEEQPLETALKALSLDHRGAILDSWDANVGSARRVREQIDWTHWRYNPFGENRERKAAIYRDLIEFPDGGVIYELAKKGGWYWCSSDHEIKSVLEGLSAENFWRVTSKPEYRKRVENAAELNFKEWTTSSKACEFKELLSNMCSQAKMINASADQLSPRLWKQLVRDEHNQIDGDPKAIASFVEAFEFEQSRLRGERLIAQIKRGEQVQARLAAGSISLRELDLEAKCALKLAEKYKQFKETNRTADLDDSADGRLVADQLRCVRALQADVQSGEKLFVSVKEGEALYWRNQLYAHKQVPIPTLTSSEEQSLLLYKQCYESRLSAKELYQLQSYLAATRQEIVFRHIDISKVQCDSKEVVAELAQISKFKGKTSSTNNAVAVGFGTGKRALHEEEQKELTGELRIFGAVFGFQVPGECLDHAYVKDLSFKPGIRSGLHPLLARLEELAGAGNAWDVSRGVEGCFTTQQKKTIETAAQERFVTRLTSEEVRDIKNCEQYGRFSEAGLQAHSRLLSSQERVFKFLNGRAISREIEQFNADPGASFVSKVGYEEALKARLTEQQLKEFAYYKKALADSSKVWSHRSTLDVVKHAGGCPDKEFRQVAEALLNTRPDERRDYGPGGKRFNELRAAIGDAGLSAEKEALILSITRSLSDFEKEHPGEKLDLSLPEKLAVLKIEESDYTKRRIKAIEIVSEALSENDRARKEKKKVPDLRESLRQDEVFANAVEAVTMRDTWAQEVRRLSGSSSRDYKLGVVAQLIERKITSSKDFFDGDEGRYVEYFIVKAPPESLEKLKNDSDERKAICERITDAKQRQLASNVLTRGEARLADKLRALCLGAGGEEKEAELKEILGSLSPEQHAQMVKDYANSYGYLLGDVKSKFGDKPDFAYLCRERDWSAEELAQQHADQFRAADIGIGFGGWNFNPFDSIWFNCKWNGSKEGLQECAAAFNRAQVDCGGRPLTAAQMAEFNRNMGHLRHGYDVSREAMLEDSISAVMFAASLASGGGSSLRLLWLAAAGGVFKVAAKAAFLKDYSLSNAWSDFLTGGAEMGANCLDTEAVMKLLGVGRRAAAKAAEEAIGKLACALTKEETALLKTAIEKRFADCFQRCLSHGEITAEELSKMFKAVVESLPETLAKKVGDKGLDTLQQAFTQQFSKNLVVCTRPILQEQARKGLEAGASYRAGVGQYMLAHGATGSAQDLMRRGARKLGKGEVPLPLSADEWLETVKAGLGMAVFAETSRTLRFSLRGEAVAAKPQARWSSNALAEMRHLGVEATSMAAGGLASHGGRFLFDALKGSPLDSEHYRLDALIRDLAPSVAGRIRQLHQVMAENRRALKAERKTRAGIEYLSKQSTFDLEQTRERLGLTGSQVAAILEQVVKPIYAKQNASVEDKESALVAAVNYRRALQAGILTEGQLERLAKLPDEIRQKMIDPAVNCLDNQGLEHVLKLAEQFKRLNVDAAIFAEMARVDLLLHLSLDPKALESVTSKEDFLQALRAYRSSEATRALAHGELSIQSTNLGGKNNEVYTAVATLENGRQVPVVVIIPHDAFIGRNRAIAERAAHVINQETGHNGRSEYPACVEREITLADGRQVTALLQEFAGEPLASYEKKGRQLTPEQQSSLRQAVLDRVVFDAVDMNADNFVVAGSRVCNIDLDFAFSTRKQPRLPLHSVAVGLSEGKLLPEEIAYLKEKKKVVESQRKSLQTAGLELEQIDAVLSRIDVLLVSQRFPKSMEQPALFKAGLPDTVPQFDKIEAVKDGELSPLSAEERVIHNLMRSYAELARRRAEHALADTSESQRQYDAAGERFNLLVRKINEEGALTPEVARYLLEYLKLNYDNVYDPALGGPVLEHLHLKDRANASASEPAATRERLRQERLTRFAETNQKSLDLLHQLEKARASEDQASVQKVKAQLVEHLFPLAQELARIHGLPEGLICKEMLRFESQDCEGRFTPTRFQITLNSSTAEPVTTLAHEMLHLRKCFERSALEMADPVMFSKMVAESVAAEIGTGSYRIDDQTVRRRTLSPSAQTTTRALFHRCVQQLLHNHVNMFNQADVAKIISNYRNELVKEGKREELLKLDNLTRECGGNKALVEEIHGELSHFQHVRMKQTTDACGKIPPHIMKITGINPSEYEAIRVSLSRALEKRKQYYLDLKARSQGELALERMMRHALRKSSASLPDSGASPGKDAIYLLSPEEISARRHQLTAQMRMNMFDGIDAEAEKDQINLQNRLAELAEAVHQITKSEGQAQADARQRAGILANELLGRMDASESDFVILANYLKERQVITVAEHTEYIRRARRERSWKQSLQENTRQQFPPSDSGGDETVFRSQGKRLYSSLPESCYQPGEHRVSIGGSEIIMIVNGAVPRTEIDAVVETIAATSQRPKRLEFVLDQESKHGMGGQYVKESDTVRIFSGKGGRAKDVVCLHELGHRRDYQFDHDPVLRKRFSNAYELDLDSSKELIAERLKEKGIYKSKEQVERIVEYLKERENWDHPLNPLADLDPLSEILHDLCSREVHAEVMMLAAKALELSVGNGKMPTYHELLKKFTYPEQPGRAKLMEHCKGLFDHCVEYLKKERSDAEKRS